mmetsp:Transcript_4167/g.11657  ORF Transcript_4167/g.11657 Transcript_4167/m.11657 type:complete len:308 (-) Transcript_4167:393-1316(-)
MNGAMRHNVDVETLDHVPVDIPRGVNEDVVRVLAAEHAQHTLIEVENREVGAAVPVDDLVRVDSHNEVVAELAGVFKDLDVSVVEHIPGAVHVNDLRPRGRLDDILGEGPHDGHLGVEPAAGMVRERLLRRDPRDGAPSAHQLLRALVQRAPVVGLLVVVMAGCTEQHASHKVGRAHPLRAGNVLELPSPLHLRIDVLPIHQTRIVPVHHVVHIVLFHNHVQVLWAHNVGRALHHLVHETASPHGGAPLLIRHYRWESLTLRDRVGTVHTYNEVCAQRAAQPERVHVSVVHQIERALHKYANFTLSR